MKALHMAFLLLLVGISFVLLERRGETGMLLVMSVIRINSFSGIFDNSFAFLKPLINVGKSF